MEEREYGIALRSGAAGSLVERRWWLSDSVDGNYRFIFHLQSVDGRSETGGLGFGTILQTWFKF